MDSNEVQSTEIADLLARLVEKSLVQVDEQSGRYSMLETVHEFAAELLEEEGATRRMQDAHLRTMVTTAGQLWPNPLTPTPVQLVETVSKDKDNYRAAIEYAVSCSRWEDALTLLSRVGESLFFAGAGFLEPTLEKVLNETMRSPLVNERLAILFGRTYINLRSNHPEIGLRWANAAVQYAEAMQDGEALIATYSLAGTAARHMQRYEEAEGLLQKALTLCEQIHSDHSFRVLNSIGMLYVDTERYQEAAVTLDHALALERVALDPFIEYNVLDSAVRANVGLGELQKAKSLLRKMIELWPRVFSSARIILCDRVAQVLVEDGQMRQAYVLLTFSKKTIGETDVGHMPSEVRAWQALFDRCESALAEDVIAECKQIGEQMSMNDALMLARVAAEA